MKKHFIICSNCKIKKERKRKSNKEINFCGTSCQLKYEYKNGIRDKQKITEKANKIVRKKSIEKFKTNPTFKVGKRGYLLIYIPIKGWKKYHHFIWEKYNKSILKGYHLHHIDQDKFNNKIENLQMISNSEHQKLHHRLRNKLGQFKPD